MAIPTIDISGNGSAIGAVGDYFVLTGNHTDFYLDGSGNAVFVNGNDDVVVLSGRGADNRIDDRGQGINITDFGTQNLQIWGFQNDHVGTIGIVANSYTLQPDGHGGTMIDFTYGGIKSTIDVVGDSNLSRAQVGASTPL